MPREIQYRGRKIVLPDEPPVAKPPQRFQQFPRPDHERSEHPPADHPHPHAPHADHPHPHGEHPDQPLCNLDHVHTDDCYTAPPQPHAEPSHTQDPPPEPGHPTGGHGGHGAPITVKIDGQDVTAHQLRLGHFHTHRLPFMQFSTLEDLAKAVVNQMQLGTRRGRQKKSE